MKKVVSGVILIIWLITGCGQRGPMPAEWVAVSVANNAKYFVVTNEKVAEVAGYYRKVTDPGSDTSLRVTSNTFPAGTILYEIPEVNHNTAFAVEINGIYYKVKYYGTKEPT